jgi:hypothetical protein
LSKFLFQNVSMERNGIERILDFMGDRTGESSEEMEPFSGVYTFCGGCGILLFPHRHDYPGLGVILTAQRETPDCHGPSTTGGIVDVQPFVTTGDATFGLRHEVRHALRRLKGMYKAYGIDL